MSSKPAIVAVVSALAFALGATPVAAAPQTPSFTAPAPDVVEAPAQPVALQTLSSAIDSSDDQALDALIAMSDLSNTPHSFDVAAAIAQAESEIGTSRATGWSQPGECIMSARRWIEAGGGAWTGRGDPVTNYTGATRLTIENAQPGDVVQYENIEFPTSWVSGVHTVLITERHDDGTFTIIESNNPAGSGLVSKNEHWTPAPPEGFQAVVWRF